MKQKLLARFAGCGAGGAFPSFFFREKKALAKKSFNCLLMVLFLAFSLQNYAQDKVTQATWNFQTGQPESIKNVSIESTTGWVASTATPDNATQDFSNYILYVDASSGGKLAYRTSADAQFNSGTKLQVPVFKAKDVVTVVSYPNYYNYTVAGVAATDNTTTYTVTSDDATVGYVEIVATSTAYLYSITVDYNTDEGSIRMKCLYESDFTEWEKVSASTTVSEYVKTARYTDNEFSFEVYNCDICPDASTKTTNFTSWWSAGAIVANKDATNIGYIEIGELESITKVSFSEAATGSNRGWVVYAKGEGDGDWVKLYDTGVPASNTKTDVDVEVNRERCSLRFENSITPDQNAYLLSIQIYGSVDFGTTPVLESFKFNDEAFDADKVFTTKDDEGNWIGTIATTKVKELYPSDSNLPTDIEVVNGEVAKDCQGVEKVTYAAASGDENAKGTVTMTIVYDGEVEGGETATEVTYILSFSDKPDYTVTYIDGDGKEIEGASVEIEQDATIGENLLVWADTYAKDGDKEFRGWVLKPRSKDKIDASYVITGDLTLYPMLTYNELKNGVYFKYDLTSAAFDQDDHERFSSTGSYHNEHGWIFSSSVNIELVVEPGSVVTFGLCQFSSDGNIVISKKGDPLDEQLVTFDAKVDACGDTYSYTYEGGDGATLVVTFTGGSDYIHSITIANVGSMSVVTPDATNGELYYYSEAFEDDTRTDHEKGDIFLYLLDAANAEAGSDRSRIFLPDGTYDLGDVCLTAVSRDNISIIGQSEKGTIIVNTAPEEGIGVSATIYNSSSNLYMQDLTLKNAYDYYQGGDGRAVCLQDKGANTICKRVILDSYQDTYYSNCDNNLYFETSRIHGTVDYICGSGNVFFNTCRLLNEAHGESAGEAGNVCYITAPNTDATCDFGYVFMNCEVGGLEGQHFLYGRTWNYSPRCVWIGTTIDYPDYLGDVAGRADEKNRWLSAGMNSTSPTVFAEYGTVDAQGNSFMPTVTEQTFYGSTQSIVLDNQGNTTSDRDIAYYTYANFSAVLNWDPRTEAQQVKLEGEITATTDEKTSTTTITWTANDEALTYAVFVGKIFVGFTSVASYTFSGTLSETDFVEVRAANQNGGLGEAITLGTDPSPDPSPEPAEPAPDPETAEPSGLQVQVVARAAELVARAYYDLAGRKLSAPERGVNIVIEYYSDGSQTTKTQLTK